MPVHYRKYHNFFHFEDNMRKQFKDPKLIKLLWKATRATTETDFKHCLQAMQKIDPKCHDWLLNTANLEQRFRKERSVHDAYMRCNFEWSGGLNSAETGSYLHTHGDIQVFLCNFADFADFEDFNWPTLQEGAVCS